MTWLNRGPRTLPFNIKFVMKFKNLFSFKKHQNRWTFINNFAHVKRIKPKLTQTFSGLRIMHFFSVTDFYAR